MTYIYSFVFCGILCLIAQLIIDNTKLSSGHITSLFVMLGSFLDIFDIYDKIIDKVGGGALVPITSFGHSLIHASLDQGMETGFFGLAFGMFNMTATGITAVIVISFFIALVFKPKN